MNTKLYKILFEDTELPSNVKMEPIDQEDDLLTVDDSEASDAIQDDADLIVSTLEGVEEREEGIDSPENEAEEETDKTTSTANDAEGAEELEKALEETPPDVDSGFVFEALGDKATVEKLISKSGGMLRNGGSKNGAHRLRLTDPKQDISKAIKNSLRGLKFKIVPPGNETGNFPSKSGKFNTYYISTPGGFIAVIFSAGANEGQKFEKALKNSIASRKGKAFDALTTALYKFYRIEPTDIARVIKTAGGSKRVKRPLTAKPANVGALLTDLTLLLTNGEEIYVSVKNVSGATFANTGYSNAFVKKTVGVKNVIEAQPSTTSPATDEFLAACGVDKQLIAKGLTDYMNRTVSKKSRNIAFAADYSKVQNFLTSALGYGYIYFRQMSNGGYKTIDLGSLAKAKKVIGSVTDIDVSYPFYLGPGQNEKSKQCTIKISTSTGDVYIVEIRSTKGGVIDNMQCNIKTSS